MATITADRKQSNEIEQTVRNVLRDILDKASYMPEPPARATPEPPPNEGDGDGETVSPAVATALEKLLRDLSPEQVGALGSFFKTIGSQPGEGEDEEDKALTEEKAEIAKLGLSENGARFIAEFEGVRLKLYNDPAGHCTIGIGHLVHRGRCNGSEPASFKRGLTKQQAYSLLRKDAQRYVRCVNQNVKVPLNQNQVDALTSFVYNLGCGAFQGSTLLKKLNKGQYKAVPHELNKWVYAGDKVLPGLVRRRKAEGALFMKK